MTTLLAIFIISNLIISPSIMLDATLSTLSLWISKVFPSLFPFMVCSGILTRCGGAELIGKLFRPIMRPLFNLSGICSFPLIMGILSGYPMGAKLTATLYEDKKITLSEATHLMYFSNNAGPLFLVGTVGASFFSSPEIGYLLLISSFCGAILCGIIYKFIKPKDLNKVTCSNQTYINDRIENASFFDILNVSISSSLSTIAQIGGFMIFFSVLITALNTVGFSAIWNIISTYSGIPFELWNAIFSGILEMTTGVYGISQTEYDTDVRLIIVCVLVCFGGCSILGQTFAMIKNLPIKKSHYIMAKLINSVISSFIFQILYKNFYTETTIEVFRNLHRKSTHFFSIDFYIIISTIIFSLLIVGITYSYFREKTKSKTKTKTK